MFGDAELNGLEQQIDTSNQTLIIAFDSDRNHIGFAVAHHRYSQSFRSEQHRVHGNCDRSRYLRTQFQMHRDVGSGKKLARWIFNIHFHQQRSARRIDGTCRSKPGHDLSLVAEQSGGADRSLSRSGPERASVSERLYAPLYYRLLTGCGALTKPYVEALAPQVLDAPTSSVARSRDESGEPFVGQLEVAGVPKL